MVKPQDCPSFDSCDATMCPLGDSVGWLDKAAWFPGEEICNCQGPKPRWVEIQHRIDKATNRDPKRGFFTLRMLEVLNSVHPSIRGIDVDTKDEAADVEKWCRSRRRAVLTPEDIERRRLHGKRRAKELNRNKVGRSAQDRSDFCVQERQSSDADSQVSAPGHSEGGLYPSQDGREKITRELDS